MAIAEPNIVKRRLISAMALAVCALPLQCATLERLSLDDMIIKSTAIVRGKVAGSYAAFSGRVIYTHYSVQVLEPYKGSGKGLIDVAVPGGIANNLRQTFSGAPELSPGEQYVFFLWTGRSGMTQVIGLSQGLFALSGGSADPTATRQASRELMLAPASAIPVKDKTLVMSLSELRARIAAVLGTADRSAQQ